MVFKALFGQQVAARLLWSQLTKQAASQLPTSKVVMPDLIRHPEFTFKRVNTGFRIKSGMTVNGASRIQRMHEFNNWAGLVYGF